MVQNSIEQKFTYLFTWFDRTGDGQLTRDDFQGIGEVFAAVAPDEPNKNALREAFMLWWDVLGEAGAPDSRGRIGPQEFITAMRTHVAADAKTIERLVMPIIDALMRALDTDKSGMLTADEYVRMYDALGIDPATSAPAFQRLDRNGSGTITHDEFRTAIEEFYLSTDTEAPGNWLLGSPLPRG
ncbi:calcium-binding protein [Nonomuraea sp. PA05]|uniref:EF-hand domain-containing protein n=1 Tax=Nonomuraea sp. PA05 TaxID=2604466 RepID=UPI0011D5E27A|nr:EF-hand domain-containing protein [Nonomuraea sp. PA05]TYB69327.1 calcium-binding protein [Nonomuraea sp. PA05]